MLGRVAVRWACRVLVLGSMSLVVACGEDGTGNEAEGGGAGASADASAGAGGDGGSGGAPGTGGVSGTGGSSGPDCTGTWGSPEVVLASTAQLLGSIAVTADELDMYYVEQPTSADPQLYTHAHRTSKTVPFPSGGPVAELNAACAEASRSIDITDDGLHAYIGCGSNTLGPEDIYFADRASRTSPFQFHPELLGTGGLAFSIARGEFLGLSSGLTFGEPPILFTRSDVTQPFDSPTAVPGLETTVLNSPELTDDYLTLFGRDANQALIVTTRSSPGGTFGAPTTIALPEMNYGSPHIMPDCKTLYFTHLLSDRSWQVEVVRR